MTLPPIEHFLEYTEYTRPVDIKKLSFIYSAISNYVVSSKKDIADVKILDIGCGDGDITLPMASLGCRIKALDINESRVAHMVSNIEKASFNNISVIIDNALTFSDGQKYDIAVASEVFEHVPGTDKLAANIAKNLVQGGYLILTTPNGYGPWELKNKVSPFEFLRKSNILRKMMGKQLYVKGSGGDHCNSFTRSYIKKALATASFKEVAFGRSDSFMGVFGRCFTRSQFIGKFDTKIADVLPYWMASGWYFVFQYDPSGVAAELTSHK